jgi:hypothetical protein
MTNCDKLARDNTIPYPKENDFDGSVLLGSETHPNYYPILGNSYEEVLRNEYDSYSIDEAQFGDTITYESSEEPGYIYHTATFVFKNDKFGIQIFGKPNGSKPYGLLYQNKLGYGLYPKGPADNPDKPVQRFKGKQKK